MGVVLWSKGGSPWNGADMKAPTRAVRPPSGLRRAAFHRLRRLQGRRVARAILDQTDVEFASIDIQGLAVRWGARHLLAISAFAVALDRSLRAHDFSPEASASLISDAVFASIRRSRDLVDLISRIRFRDRLDGVRWASAMSKKHYYAEPDWEITDVEAPRGVGLDITRCVIAEFFASMDACELGERVICNQDHRSAARHGLGFARSNTLMAGADRCDFRYSIDRSVEDEPAFAKAAP